MQRRVSGFTIVELLVVIVVIAVLAAVSVVAYNGIQQRARASAAQALANQVGKKVAVYFTTEGEYPGSLGVAGITDTSKLQYSVNNGVEPKTYCVTATEGGVPYYVSSTQATPKSGGCVGHTGGPVMVVNLVPNPRLATSAYYSNQSPAASTIVHSPSGGPQGGGTYTVTTTQADVLRIAYINTGSAIPASPGNKLTTSFYLNSSISVTSPRVETLWQRANGSVYWNSATITSNITTGWQRYNTTVTVPADATGIRAMQLITTGTNVPVGATFSMANTMLTAGDTLYPYADGASPDWQWNGAADNSTSSGPVL